MFKAQHTIITLVTEYNFKTARTVHNFHSQGSILCRASYHGVTGKYMYMYILNISFASYRVPIYTHGWRTAVWIKCLAEGQQCQTLTGIEPATLWSRVKGSIQYTTAPPQNVFISHSFGNTAAVSISIYYQFCIYVLSLCVISGSVSRLDKTDEEHRSPG